MKAANLTKSEALELLKCQEKSDEPSEINPGLTQTELLEILQGVVNAQPDGYLKLALVAEIRRVCGIKVERS